MRIRHLTILPLFALLSGCGLPPAIAVASYAADGLLLVTTGKSSTDHALSFATGEDCAMWRVVESKAVCTELSPEGGGQIVLAKTGDMPEIVDSSETGDSEPAIAAAPPGAITSEALAPPAAEFAAASDGGTAPAHPDMNTTGTLVPADRVAVSGTLTPGDRAATGAPVSLVPAAATAEAPATVAPIAPIVSPADATRVARIEPISPVSSPRLIAVAELPRGTAVAAAAPAPASRPAPASAGEALPAGHYFVLASYRDRANAERHAGTLRAAPARIMPTEIDGIAHYRVLAGPYAPAERATAQAALAEAGIDESWPLDLCNGACADTSQIASAD